MSGTKKPLVCARVIALIFSLVASKARTFRLFTILNYVVLEIAKWLSLWLICTINVSSPIDFRNSPKSHEGPLMISWLKKTPSLIRRAQSYQSQVQTPTRLKWSQSAKITKSWRKDLCGSRSWRPRAPPLHSLCPHILKLPNLQPRASA